MIARIWNGITKTQHAAKYQEIIEQRDLPNYRNAQGFVSFTFLRDDQEHHTHFKLITIWEDLDALKSFTGPVYDKAVGFEEDRHLVTDWPGQVTHHQVFTKG